MFEPTMLLSIVGTIHTVGVQNGWTALMQASFGGHVVVVESLVECGARLDVVNNVRQEMFTILTHTSLAFLCTSLARSTERGNRQGHCIDERQT